MQFTGLLDKNGKEIYEGDVLELPGMGHCVVEFGEQLYEDGTAYGYDGWKMQNGNVIGNIYQNPELLTKENA